MVEIERKFLITSDVYKSEANRKTRIIQGFLNRDKERTVRIRLRDDQAYITVKGESSEDGVSRFEWEMEIPKTDAQALLNLCEKGVIDKIRYEVQFGNHLFEVDEFFGENEGLIVAEVELDDVSEFFEKPKWLGEEVTGNPKYYNSQLSKHPFKDWK